VAHSGRAAARRRPKSVVRIILARRRRIASAAGVAADSQQDLWLCVGMQLSAVSQNFQNLVKLVCAWTTKELPDFPFSSLQINYNYAARKHVDGNNIGPSYIRSLGKHTGITTCPDKIPTFSVVEMLCWKA